MYSFLVAILERGGEDRNLYRRKIRGVAGWERKVLGYTGIGGRMGHGGFISRR